MGILTDPAERWAAQTLSRASRGEAQFAADAATEIVAAVRALPVAERAGAWLQLDAMTETGIRRAEVGQDRFDVLVHPVSRPDSAAAAILSQACQEDLDAVDGLVIGEVMSGTGIDDGSRVSAPSRGTLPAGDPIIRVIRSINFADDPMRDAGLPQGLVETRVDADGNARITLTPRGWVASAAAEEPSAAIAPAPAPAPDPAPSRAMTFRIVPDADPLKRLVISDDIGGERFLSDEVLRALRGLNGPASTSQIEAAIAQVGSTLVRDMLRLLAQAGRIRSTGAGWIVSD